MTQEPIQQNNVSDLIPPRKTEAPPANTSFNNPKQKEQLFWYLRQARNQQVPQEEIILRFLKLGWPGELILEGLKQLPVYKANIMIGINNVTKNFQIGDSEQLVLRGIDLNIREGEFVSVTGRSGSGKTTLLNLIGLLDEPTSGQIVVNGNDISEFSESKRVKFRLNTVSYIFQFFNLIGSYNVIDNIAFQLRLQGYSKKKAIDKSKEIIDFLDMGEKAHSYPAKLSGGEQQRVAIGRAMAKDSLIILADEPTAHLDLKNGMAVLTLLKNINRQFGKTIILVTHEQDYAKEAETVVLLSDGRIVSTIS